MKLTELRWNPLEVKEGDRVLDHFEELKSFPSLGIAVEGIDGDKCLRFAMLITDPKTPLSKLSTLRAMLEKACELAGFKKKAGKFNKEAEMIMAMEVPEVMDMVHQLFIIHSNYKYESWFGMKLNYHQISKFIQTPPSSMDTKDLSMEMGRRSTLQKQMDEMAENLAKKEAAMFNNQYVKDATMQGVAMKMDKYTERLAKRGTAI